MGISNEAKDADAAAGRSVPAVVTRETAAYSSTDGGLDEPSSDPARAVSSGTATAARERCQGARSELARLLGLVAAQAARKQALWRQVQAQQVARAEADRRMAEAAAEADLARAEAALLVRQQTDADTQREVSCYMPYCACYADADSTIILCRSCVGVMTQ